MFGATILIASVPVGQQQLISTGTSKLFATRMIVPNLVGRPLIDMVGELKTYFVK